MPHEPLRTGGRPGTAVRASRANSHLSLLSTAWSVLKHARQGALTTVPPPAPTLGFPVPGGSISQPFRLGHEGVDIAAAPGVPVVAAEAGFVVSAGWRNNGGGLVVEIQHAGGLNTVYNHLGSIAVVSGQSVARGAVVGGMGCSGVCYGPHIQFDVRINGRLINPLALM